MGIVHLDISISLDGYIAGPGDVPEKPLGVGGDALHEWYVDSSEKHGEVVEATMRNTRAIIAGRRTYDNSRKWWGPGKGPAGDTPVFVVSHSVPDDPDLDGSVFTFVTEGVESALKQARDVAGEADVCIMGGADVPNQYLRANLVDRIQLHIVPVLLGGGARLFEDLGDDRPELRQVRVVETSTATHVTYDVVR